MAADANPITFTRDRDGILRFTGEKDRPSMSGLQNRLSRLGENVGRWSLLSKDNQLIFEPDLKMKRMEALRDAQFLRVRKGCDIDGIKYLIDHYAFGGGVAVENVAVANYVRDNAIGNQMNDVRVRVAGDTIWSDNEDYENDMTDGSLDRGDSDNGLGNAQERQFRAEGLVDWQSLTKDNMYPSSGGSSSPSP